MSVDPDASTRPSWGCSQPSTSFRLADTTLQPVIPVTRASTGAVSARLIDAMLPLPLAVAAATAAFWAVALLAIRTLSVLSAVALPIERGLSSDVCQEAG